MKPPLRTIALNALLAVAATLIVFVPVELLLRWRYAEPLRTPTPEIVAIQQHLQLHPDAGFTWKPNIPSSDEIVFTVADAKFEPLSTDSNGFINHPDAIQRTGDETSVDILGLGDSFVEHAAHTFFETFAREELTYYGLAVHRQAPPQHTVHLAQHGLARSPEWVIYGLFENDFIESEDFWNWRTSGLDWFTFHSGTWCGESLPVSEWERAREKYLRGTDALLRLVRQRARGDYITLAGPTETGVSAVTNAIAKARELTEQSDGKFLLLLIPSRATATTGTSPESEAYDTVISRLSLPDSVIIDLRKTFHAHPDPDSLYYEVDGHWNATGMKLAAEQILAHINRHENETISPDSNDEP